MTSSSSAARPWYRHPWPWIFIGMMSVTVLAGAVTLWLAVDTNDGLVADDYYKKGLGINKQLARGERALAMDLKAMLRFSPDAVSASLSAREDVNLPPRLRLIFAHPTRVGLDRVVQLNKDGPAWRGALEPLPPGRWIVTLEDDPATWRLDAAAHFPQDREIVLSAAPFKSVE